MRSQSFGAVTRSQSCLLGSTHYRLGAWGSTSSTQRVLECACCDSGPGSRHTDGASVNYACRFGCWRSIVSGLGGLALPFCGCSDLLVSPGKPRTRWLVLSNEGKLELELECRSFDATLRGFSPLGAPKFSLVPASSEAFSERRKLFEYCCQIKLFFNWPFLECCSIWDFCGVFILHVSVVQAIRSAFQNKREMITWNALKCLPLLLGFVF